MQRALFVQDDAVLHDKDIRDLGKHDIRREAQILDLLGVGKDAEILHDHLRRHMRDQRAAGRVGRSGGIILVGAEAQLLRRTEVGVAPGAALCLIGQLLQRVGAQITGILVFGIREDQHVGQLCHPLIFALVKVFLRAAQNLVHIAQILDKLLCTHARLQLAQVDGVGVIPAHVLLVNRLGIVGDRAVVLSGVPVPCQLSRKLDHVGDLGAGIALVQVQQGLVVDILVCRGRIDDILHDVLVVPVRPVVRLEDHLGVLAVELQGFHQEVCPGLTVADLSPAQGVEVVQGPGAVFRQPQGILLREPGVHLSRCFRSRGELELHDHAVNDHRLTGAGDGHVRRDVRGRPVGLSHADADAQGAGHTGLQEGAVLIAGSSCHGVAGIDVLAHGMLFKALRGDDQHVAVQGLLIGDQRRYAAVMVHVRVGIQNRLDRIVPDVFLYQLIRRLGALHRHQGVIDDPARLALDKGDVGHVVAADLINPVHDLKQAVDVVQLGVSPQAGIGGVRGILIQEGIGILAPCHLAAVGFDHQAVRCDDQAALGVFKLALVVKVQQRIDLLVGIDGILAGRLRVRVQAETVRKRGHAQHRDQKQHRQCQRA